MGLQVGYFHATGSRHRCFRCQRAGSGERVQAATIEGARVTGLARGRDGGRRETLPPNAGLTSGQGETLSAVSLVRPRRIIPPVTPHPVGKLLDTGSARAIIFGQVTRKVSLARGMQILAALSRAGLNVRESLPMPVFPSYDFIDALVPEGDAAVHSALSPA